MAIPDPKNILLAPARLCFGPTDLSLPYPHGGTGLGIVRAIAARPNVRTGIVTAEEYGGETVEAVYQGESWVLAAILREVDDDAVAKLFRNTAVGTVSQHRVVEHPGTGGSPIRAGTLLSASAIKLLVSPDAPDAPAMILYRAIPMIDAAAELSFAHATPFEPGVVFVGIRDGSVPARMVAVGRLSDLSV